MGNHWTRTMPAGLAAAVVVLATLDARAAVVLSQSNLGGLGSTGAALANESSRAEIVNETILGELSDDFQFGDSVPKHANCPEVARSLIPSSDMSPPPTIVVGGGGVGGGYALSVESAMPTPADLQALLAPEARTVLPTGPPYRWFRPPRG